jgi:hypothetical protein
MTIAAQSGAAKARRAIIRLRKLTRERAMKVLGARPSRLGTDSIVEKFGAGDRDRTGDVQRVFGFVTYTRGSFDDIARQSLNLVSWGIAA